MAAGKKQPNNAIDFGKVRKKRQRLTTVKRFAVLLAIFGGVILVLLANSWMIEQGITTQLSDLIGGIGGSGYPIAVPGGVIRDVKGAGNHLAVLNDANLLIYSDKGRQTANIQAMTDSTVLLTSEDRFLTFDVGARRFAVHSSTQTPFVNELEYGILAGGMNLAGDFAIVSSSEQAECEINVYNNSFSVIYYCALAENLATAVSIAPRGDRMAVGWLNGKDGVLASGVNIYQLSNAEGPIATLELGEDLILDMRYYEEGRVGVLTDARYFVMDAGGEILYSYDFGGRELAAFEAEGRQMLFLCEDGNGSELILLDDECRERAVIGVGERVADLALSSRRAYLLTESAIETYDLDLTLLDETPIQFGNRIELVGSRLYYLDHDEIGVLGQTRPDAPEPATDPEPVSEPFWAGSRLGTESASETGSVPDESETETDPQTEPETATDPETETDPVTDPGSEPDSEDTYTATEADPIDEPTDGGDGG